MKIRLRAGVRARPSAINIFRAVGVVLQRGETKRQPAVGALGRRLGSIGFADFRGGSWVALVALEGRDVGGGDVRVGGVKSCPTST